MKCRAWETKHQDGSKYVHVVDENLEVDIVKDIAERLARSPCENPLLRDIAGSYLLADKGHESFGFSAFTELDKSILADVESVKEMLKQLVQSNQTFAGALLAVMEKLGMREETK